MTGDPLVSVIMPLYNKRPYVERSIESIKNQTYSNWELIIVDDGSTDGSSDVVPRDNPRIKLFQQSNKGPGAARNRAVNMASGDYLAFIDADDCYYPFKLEKEMDLLWNQQKAEWMMSAYDYQLNGVTTRYYMKDLKNNEIKQETMVFDDTLNQLIVSAWPSDGLFMKRTLFERLGGFCEDMRFGEITELIFRCALMQPRIVICHIPLYLHIDAPGSTAKVSSHRVGYARQMGEHLYDMAQNYPKYSKFLTQKGRDHMMSYAATQMLSGKSWEARRFLFEAYPYEHDMRWWKILAATWLPKRVLQRLLRSSK